MKGLAPRSLFGRLMLVLAGGLVIAQLLSAAINLAERDSALFRATGVQSAQRIADIVKLLDSLVPAERERIVSILQVPPLIVSLDRAPIPEAGDMPAEAHAAIFTTVLRAALGDGRPIRVQASASPPWPPGGGRFGPRGPGRFDASDEEAAFEPGPRGLGPGPMRGSMMGGGMHRMAGLSMLTQVQLRDGSWASFDTRIPQPWTSVPWNLLGSLGVLLATVLVLSYVAVRWVTRPLKVLAAAADELGRNLDRPPLPENGPLEVQRAARAFNDMQRRLARLIEDRTRLLTAMSHDLKTPITRMRLRTEMLDDEELRVRYEKDLLEMERMVGETLDFMRGLNAREPLQPVDVMGLLESLQADNEEMGRTVTISGRVREPYHGVPALLKRCLANLVDNAVLYGARADIEVEHHSGELVIRVRDHGPGIPEKDLEAVFEPFVRLEASRSRDTGGTGLGLSIARNIARAHGGDVRLRNHPEGGLEAILTLPRGEARS